MTFREGLVGAVILTYSVMNSIICPVATTLQTVLLYLALSFYRETGRFVLVLTFGEPLIVDCPCGRRIGLISWSRRLYVVINILKLDLAIRNNPNHNTKVFTRLMLQGKIRSAIRFLTERSKGHVLHPHDNVKIQDNGQDKLTSVIDALQMKHPSPRLPHSFSLLDTGDLPDLEDLDITGNHVHQVALRIQGSAGPGGCDAAHWQDILLRYGPASRRLCDCVANLSRCLANSVLDWSLLRALLASRLIALDKSPGVRPIGVGETLRRVIGKSICLVTRDDAESVCGSVQLCAGVRCGIEGAIHSVSDLFHSNDYGSLTMDTSNAFNSINRISLIWNIRILWPRASRFIFNTYRGWSPLILWFADDSTVIGDVSVIRNWFDKLLSIGPLFGYFPEPSKSSLIVKDTTLPSAEQSFDGSGVSIVQCGRYLGGVIGNRAGIESFVSS
uniref:Reverse transcriptase domain-containing protein n=1 Tax=Amphimedon queenslandica TaxID=400682 RepID=A0A1X7TNZ6_AMPQE